MFSDIHNPSDVMFNGRIIAMTSFAFSGGSWINSRFILNNGEESRNSSSSSIYPTSTCSANFFPPAFSSFLSFNVRGLQSILFLLPIIHLTIFEIKIIRRLTFKVFKFQNRDTFKNKEYKLPSRR